MIIVLFLKGVQLAEIKTKFSEFHLFCKYLTQVHKILLTKEKTSNITKIKKQVT